MSKKSNEGSGYEYVAGYVYRYESEYGCGLNYGDRKMINSDPQLIRVYRCDSEGNKIEKIQNNDKIANSDRLIEEQWKQLIKIIKETEKK